MNSDDPLPVDFAALVQRVASDRDRAAFTVLFDHFGPRLNAYLLRLGCDAALAEEITQETMVTLWRKAELFDRSKSSVGTWLYRIARNRRIDLLRRAREDALDTEQSEQIADTADQPDEAMDLQQREAVMRDALKDLPAEQLELVRLAFFEGLSHSQIADQTGVPLGTVKSRIRLAFTRLRRSLESAGIAAQ